MRATTITISTFGAIAGLVGIEHGIGELLQGNVPPEGIVVLSWPDSKFYHILGGEPAMTIVPDLRTTGIIAIFVSLILVIWATQFIEHPLGGPGLIVVSVVLLLIGGGFGPPLLGLTLGGAATVINSARTEHRGGQPGRWRQFFAGLWPWAYGADLIAWLSLFPGAGIVSLTLQLGEAGGTLATTVYALTLSAFGLLLLAIASAYARDTTHRTDNQQ